MIDKFIFNLLGLPLVVEVINLVSLQPARSTHSSSVITLARSPTSSSLRTLIVPCDVPHLIPGTSSLLLSVNHIPVSLSLSRQLFIHLSQHLPLIHHSHHP